MQKIKKLPKAVIFDFDNTLVNTWSLMLNSINHTFSYFGKKEIDISTAKNSIHKSARDSFPDIFGEKHEEALNIYKNFYRSENHKLQPMYYAEEILKYLRLMNIDAYIISNKTNNALNFEIKNYFKWNEYFKKIVGSKDFTYDKPNPEIVKFTIGNRYPITKENIWFVGDSVIDVECANNSGCLSMILEDKEVIIDSVKKPDIKIKNLKSIKEIIENV